MSTYIFDIDGTLADPAHRLHWIKDPAHWVVKDNKPTKPNWNEFLKSERLAQDAPIPATWEILTSLVENHHQIIFITGRPEKEREMTYDWLTEISCIHRCRASHYWNSCPSSRKPVLYMRADGDKRPSHVVKEEGLDQAKLDGFKPVAAFEDRASDCAMWRRNGLICYHVAEGNF